MSNFCKILTMQIFLIDFMFPELPYSSHIHAASSAAQKHIHAPKAEWNPPINEEQIWTNERSFRT